MEVTGRSSLFAAVGKAAKGDAAAVVPCLCAYTPPAERLIIRSNSDFARLNTTAEAVHGAADPNFWAYGDFSSVLSSFSRESSDPERRVMGIEGIGSADALAAAISSGSKPLRIGHLSLLMMEGKVANGEWRWIDEGGCVMHTATPKPGLLRTELRSRLGLELVVRRHEAFLEGNAPPESCGDLIIFDMDKADVTKPTGNTKVFCQDPTAFSIAAFDSLSAEMRAAVDAVLARELRA